MFKTKWSSIVGYNFVGYRFYTELLKIILTTWQN